MNSVNVICDFDGTIALSDITDGLLDRFADPSWVQIEEQWVAGKIGSRECMARQVSLIRANGRDLDRYLDTVAIDPGFASFVEACDARDDMTLRVVSDGIDYAVRRILANHGLGRLQVVANALVVLPGGRYRLDFPYSNEACTVRAGTCKCAIARSQANTPARPSSTILIGDGASDFCVASQADFVFAKDRLLAHCEAKAIAHMPFDTFSDIERELAQVVGDFDRSIEPSPLLTETPNDA